MPWFYIYRKDTGRLVSETDNDPQVLPVEYADVMLANRADLSAVMWDDVSRGFVPRPAPVIVDRVQDLITSDAFADFRAAYGTLTPVNKLKLRDGLVRLLGGKRWRDEGEPVEVGS